ncbi:MAG: DUF5010 domain-containing protein [Candidatus Omnitrophica bacterium]|nr:DUF5010 domain-containing protein [Candidatus Omnitrophota bacterium]
MKKATPSIRCLMVCCLVGCAPLAMAQNHEIPGPVGPYIGLGPKGFEDARSFRGDDRIVGATYFYWYNVQTKEHVLNGDGSDALTDHPPSMENFSYESESWHQRQLEDMIEAGIDFLLPVFWGAPSERDPNSRQHWSYAGLKPLVQAREALLEEGKRPPRIGLFYDTSTLQFNSWNLHIDLTRDYGKRWFYATIRDFFSSIPPRHWAMIDGHPLVVLYAAAFAKKYDQSFIDYTREQFARDFGGRIPYIVREVSWNVKSDNTGAWGGALGLKNPGVASLGPGYDHSAVPGRKPLIVPRAGGEFYEENWLKFLRRASDIVLVETWNEFHEGTDVCESREYGRRYIELTRHYVDLFKQGWRPPLVRGLYTDAPSISVSLGKTNLEQGLRQVDFADGLTAPDTAGGQDCRTIRSTENPGRYIYFVADDSFKKPDPENLVVEIEYFDAATGSLNLEFDGSDPAAPFNGAYTRSAETVKLEGTRTWRDARFALPKARLLNSQNANADFRLAVQAPEFALKKAVLKRHQ